MTLLRDLYAGLKNENSFFELMTAEGLMVEAAPETSLKDLVTRATAKIEGFRIVRPSALGGAFAH